MKRALREEVTRMRLVEELSYSEIRKRLDVSKSTLSYWLRDFPLTEEKVLELRRSGWKRGEAARERYRITMQKKREIEDTRVYDICKKKLSNLSDDAFFASGLMLYLGEGDKRNYAKIGLANTDPQLINFFLDWLQMFLNIRRDQVKIELHLYEGMDIQAEKDFWKNILSINVNQFYKSSIRKLKPSSFTYGASFRHGTCKVHCFGVEKKRYIMMGARALMDLYQKKVMRV